MLWFAVPLIGGLAAGEMLESIPVFWQLGCALTAAIFAVLASRSAPRGWPPALVIAMFLTGSASSTLHRARLAVWDHLPAREARLTIRVERIFPQGDPQKASGLGTIVGADRHLGELVGQTLSFSLTAPKGELAPIRSSVVAALGLLETIPRHPPPNSFEGYLAAAGIPFKFARGRVLAVVQPASAYYQFCARAAQRFNTILGLGIAEKRPTLAGLSRAMMLGEKHALSEEQETLFLQSGTMHLFAISGLNIAVIAGALQALLLLLRLPGVARFIFGAILLWLFVDITGASPSAVRAFVMTVFLQAALALRRSANPVAALVASAVAVLLVAPLQVFNASFMMSYGIVFALLVLGLPLGEAWCARWTPWRHLPEATWNRVQRGVSVAWRWLVTSVAIGVATSLVGLLTGLQFFQLLTPGSLLTNLALIPAAMVATLGGFSAMLCGLLGFDAGAVLCNHAAALVLLLIEWIVRISVTLPWAFMPAHFSAPWIGMTALLLLLATLLVGYATDWRPARWGWWPPFVVVGLTLVFGVTFP